MKFQNIRRRMLLILSIVAILINFFPCKTAFDEQKACAASKVYWLACNTDEATITCQENKIKIIGTVYKGSTEMKAVQGNALSFDKKKKFKVAKKCVVVEIRGAEETTFTFDEYVSDNIPTFSMPITVNGFTYADVKIKNGKVVKIVLGEE